MFLLLNRPELGKNKVRLNPQQNFNDKKFHLV